MHAGRRETFAVAVVGVAIAALVHATGSLHYDDCDAALFVAAVQDFDPTANRPHPPGYPLYVLLGKLLAPLAGGPFEALRLVSALSTGAAAALLPAFFRAGGAERRPAWALAALTAVLPCFWLTGGKVLTDMPGFVPFLVCTIVMLRRPESGFWAGALVGLLAGVRPHFLIAIVPLVLSRRPIPRLLGMAVGAAVWIGGIASVIGGRSTLDAAGRQIGMRFERPGVSMFSPGEDLGLRAKHHTFELMHDAIGITPLPLRMVAAVALLLGAVAVIRDRRFARLRPLVIGAIGYGAFVFAFLPAEPRYVLVTAPVLALMATRADARIALVVALLLLPVTVDRAVLMRTSVPTPERAIAWMDEQDPERRLPSVGAQLFPHLRVLAPTRPAPGDLAAEDLPPEFFVTRADLDWIAARDAVEVLVTTTFERPRTIHLKDHVLEVLRCRRVGSN